MEQPVIEAECLVKDYRTVRALDCLSFRLYPGVSGLLGPNGAGKTTCLKILAGLLLPTGGQILIKGKSPLETRGEVGYIPEIPSPYPYLRVDEFLTFCARLYGKPPPEIAEKMDSYLERWDLLHKKKDMVKTLSKGQLQKISILSMLIAGCSILLLDEPFLGLDPKSQFVLKQIIKEEVLKGKTVLISTHILEWASQTCDNVMIINKGQLVAQGDLKALQEISGQQGNLEEVFLRLTADSGEGTAHELDREYS
ncbi:MAG: ABC transporter ATP-binding protein [Candidatus Odinarchaeota archaeon]